MGLKFKSMYIISLMFSMLFGLILLIGIAFGQYSITLISFSVFLAVLIIGIQYLLGPLLIGWIFRVKWLDYAEVVEKLPEIAQHIRKITEKEGIKSPKFGIIFDGNPNAFCYGWSRNSARLVVTEGIIQLLNKDEQVSVVSHELGHITHKDFITMVIISTIPTIAYYLYIFIRRSMYTARYRSRNSRSDSTTIFLILMVAAYMVYIIGHFLALLLSRIREYWSDEFSAVETGNANHLSSALVKIAYGLTGAKDLSLNNTDSSIVDTEEEDIQLATSNQMYSKINALRAFGISDPKESKNLLFAAAANSGNQLQSIETAAAWDLHNPWARYFEIGSTHPLPAKRILALNQIAETQGIKPIIDLSHTKELAEKQAGKTMWDEFIEDLLIHWLPWLVFYGTLGLTLGWFLYASYTSSYLFGITNLGLLFGFSFIFIGLAKIIKTEYKYRGGYEPAQVADCLRMIKASPIRGIPVIVTGKLIGRGIPGYILSEDMVVQDPTGFIRIDYHFGISLIDFWWAITKIEKYKGMTLKIWGWYRRAPGPYVQVQKIEVVDVGKIHKNHAKLMAYIGTLFMFVFSILSFMVL
jgi:heat shock protein HtpX